MFSYLGDGDVKYILLSILMYLQIDSTYIYNNYPKLTSIFWVLESQTNHVLSHLTGRATLQDDVIANFQFQISVARMFI